MVKDASAALLIADAGLEKLVDEFSGPVLLTDDIVSLPKGSPAAVIIGHTVGCLILLTHWRRKSPSLSLLGPQRMSFARDLGSILSSGAPLAVASVCLTLLLFSANSIVLDTLGRGASSSSAWR